jgi:hypothetical protein
MARYTRIEIDQLCKRLELHSTSICGTPQFIGDLKAASMLLRLFMALAEIQTIETGLGGFIEKSNDGQKMN